MDGTERARFGPGDFFGEISVLLGVLPVADIVATRDTPGPGAGGPGDRVVPGEQPPHHLPDAPGDGSPAAGIEPVDGLAPIARPIPDAAAMNAPGSYPVIVIGSGPGGLQVSWSLR